MTTKHENEQDMKTAAEAEARMKVEAELKAKADAEAKAKMEAEAKAKTEAEDKAFKDQFEAKLKTLSIEELNKYTAAMNEAKVKAEQAGETAWYQKVWGAIKRFFQKWVGGAVVGAFIILLIGTIANALRPEMEMALPEHQ